MRNLSPFPVAAVAALGGCFGEGPLPTSPTGATVVFHVGVPARHECEGWTYVADVALGLEYGYALTLPFPPPDCGNPGSILQLDVPVFRFAKAGGSTVDTERRAGRSGFGFAPRVATHAGQAAWAFVDTSMSGSSVKVEGDPVGVMAMLPQMAGFQVPVGIAADAQAVYVATQNNQSSGNRSEVNSPDYPCCGPPANPSDPGNVYRVPPGGAAVVLPIAPKFSCGNAKTCFVDNSASLIYSEVDGNATRITRFPKAGMSAGEAESVALVPRNQGVLVGLGANDATIAWSVSVAYESWPYPPPRCTIHALDLAGGSPRLLADIDRFSCMDASVDDTHVYFAIVRVGDESQRMTGRGIGRVSLATGEVETLHVGIIYPSAGARRIYLDGDDLYAVDPYAIARISKSALAGRDEL